MEKITKKISNIVFPIFNEILYIFGLKVLELSGKEVDEINHQILEGINLEKIKNLKRPTPFASY